MPLFQHARKGCRYDSAPVFLPGLSPIPCIRVTSQNACSNVEFPWITRPSGGRIVCLFVERDYGFIEKLAVGVVVDLGIATDGRRRLFKGV